MSAETADIFAAGSTDEEKLDTIAAMDAMQYERARAALAKSLGMRTAALDQARAERRRAEADRLEARAKAEAQASGTDIVGAMNREHAAVWVGDEFRILWRNQFDGGAPRITSIDAARAYYRNHAIAGGANPVDVWLEAPGRADFDRIAFAPGSNDPRVFNLWRGWAVAPAAGECSMILEHIHEVIARGDEHLFAYFIDWLADIAQHPGDPKGTAVALRGGAGVGKGSVYRYLEAVFTPYVVHLISAQHFTGRFNDHLVAKLLVFVDEAAWAGDRAQRGQLKGLITERRILVERKHQPAFEIENHARFLFATNEVWAIPADIDDRRFVMLDVAEHRRDDAAYWRALNDELVKGGDAALLDHLMRHAITSDLRCAPATKALATQKLLSLDDVGRFWRQLLTAKAHILTRGIGPDRRSLYLDFGKVCLTTTMHEFYLEHARKMRVAHPASLDALGQAARRLCPAIAKREARKGEVPDDSARRQVYVLPELDEARSQFSQALRQQFEWSDAEEELQW